MGTINRIAETLTVLIIFAVVLAITYLVTRFVAGYQKTQMSQGNIQILETTRISQTKYLQLIRVGEKYVVIAVCKDNITMITTVEKEQLDFSQKRDENGKTDFKEILSEIMQSKKKDSK